MRVKNITQRFQAFVRNLRESFWGDFQGQMRHRLKELLEKDAEQQMAEYLGLKWHERGSEEKPRIDSRNGFYERDYAAALGMIRLRIPRTRLRSFLPRCIRPLERRSPEVAELIRQAPSSSPLDGRRAPIPLPLCHVQRTFWHFARAVLA